MPKDNTILELTFYNGHAECGCMLVSHVYPEDNTRRALLRLCPEHASTQAAYGREKEWVLFADLVRKHIREYAVPRYGDWPSDLATEMTVDQGIGQIRKYIARFGSGVRGDERLLDLAKIAHYACMVYGKVQDEIKERDE